MNKDLLVSLPDKSRGSDHQVEGEVVVKERVRRGDPSVSGAIFIDLEEEVNGQPLGVELTQSKVRLCLVGLDHSAKCQRSISLRPLN